VNWYNNGLLPLIRQFFLAPNRINEFMWILLQIHITHTGEEQRKNFCLLGYNAMQSVESQQTFRRNMSPPSSGSKNKPSKKTEWKHVESRIRLILPPCRWRQHVLPKRRLTFNELHGVISLNTELIITEAVRTSNPKHTKICIISEYTVPHNVRRVKFGIEFLPYRSYKHLNQSPFDWYLLGFRRIKLKRFNTTQSDWLWSRRPEQFSCSLPTLERLWDPDKSLSSMCGLHPFIQCKVQTLEAWRPYYLYAFLARYLGSR
jgi:hypothetical protein